MVRAGIVGAGSYGAAELLRLLRFHPAMQVTYIASESGAGKPAAEVFPQLRGAVDLEFVPYRVEEAAEAADVLFLTGKNGLAMQLAPALLDAGRKVVDFSADFRLRDPAEYERVYGAAHTCPDLLAEAVYGIPELNRAAIRQARLVANPGCYPTAAILVLSPLLHSRDGEGPLIDPSTIIIDAYSGVSGAGRSAVSLSYHFPEVNDSLTAYKVIGHRHSTEIEQALSLAAGRAVAVTFTPHLAPTSRGILETIYATLKRSVSAAELRAYFERVYADEPFVVVLPEGEIPRTGSVRGSNYVQLSVAIDPRLHRMTVIAAEDNLVKGAAGQALQNMNIMCGLPEDAGLQGTGIYP